MKAINDDFFREESADRQPLYSTGVELRRSLAEIPEADAAGELKRVMESVGASRRRTLSVGMRRIAVAASVILVVGTVAATVVFGNLGFDFRASRPEPAGQQVGGAGKPAVITYAPDDSVTSGKPAILTQGKVYEDVALEDILRDVSSHFGVVVECAPDKAAIRFYLSIPDRSSLGSVVMVLNSFEQLDAEIITDTDNTQKLIVR